MQCLPWLKFRGCLLFNMRNAQNEGNEYQWREQAGKLIIIQIIIRCGPRSTSKQYLMPKFKPNLVSGPYSTSSLLLNHIKDQQFYSTLSTITLQLVKEAGANKKVIQELEACFSKVKGSANQPMLTFKKQNYLDDKNISRHPSESYESFQKDISFKEQVDFLGRMENQLIQSREKQTYINSLNKYASEKQFELLPLLQFQTPTKASRFKSLLGRKKRSKACTTPNYFRLNPLDLLKNAYQNSNQCYSMMRSFTLLKTMYGHSMDDDRQSNCPLYNVLFDQSQQLVISGGQQGAIKIWSKQTGLLLSSLKGHQEYINKLEVTKCNRYICSSAGDGVRFFLLRDMTTLGGWKAESIIDIASIYDRNTKLNKFMFGDKKNLYVLDETRMLASQQTEQRLSSRALSKEDFCIYKYSHKMSKQSHILMIQINDDQTFVLLGFETGEIILFHYKDLFSIDPIKNQTEPLSNYFNLPVRHQLRVHRDEIRELKWHQNNQYFVSGGKQGYCLLWEYKNQKVPTVLKQIQVSKLFNRRKKRAFGCNFICYNCTYSHFIAGFMELVDEDDQDRGNGDVIAYSLEERQVIFEFSKDMPIKVASVRGIDTHPTYPNIAVICEGTGRILIIDFLLKTILNTFELRGFHLLHPHFALNPGDCRFSKDGKYFVVSTQFGSVSIFGYDVKNFYESCPTEQFFCSDFTAFTVNQKMQPIPIQGDFQIDMNRVQRGQIRNIRGDTYQKQLSNNFQKYWDSFEESSALRPVDHRNTLMTKDEDSQDYMNFLDRVKFNLGQAQNFNSFYSKNLEQIEGSKQSLLYDQRQKQSRVFKKIIQQKLRKLRGDSVNGLPELTHDLILEQIDAKGRRGGRKLVRVGHRQNCPNYKDENFDYDSRNEQDYNIQEDNPEQLDLNQLDCELSGSQDQIPRVTRRQNRHTHMFLNRNREAQTRYNIRSRPSQNYNYDQNQEQEQEYEQKVQRNLKRRSPAQDIEDMLKDDEFRNYDMSKGRKKRKRNRMREDEDEDYMRNQGHSEYAGQSSNNHLPRRRDDNSFSGRRGRSKKGPIAQVQAEQQESSEHYSRLRKREQKIENQDLYDDYGIQEGNNAHNLRNRHQSSNLKCSQKKISQKDFGQCFRCAVNPAVVICNGCECACCQSCKDKRGKQFGQDEFTCFVCMYVNSSGISIVQERKLSEQHFRLSKRSDQVYVPQIDDQVRFFFQGYEEFLAHNIRNLNIEPIAQVEDYLLMPHIYNQIYGQTLLETPLCRVKDIRYLFPFTALDALSTTYKRRTNASQKRHVNMLINLEIVLDQSKQKQLGRTDFWVFFIPEPISIDSDSQFLIREQIYKYVEQNKVLGSLTQNQTVYIYGEEYQILQIRAAQDCFPQSIWRQMKVSRSDSKRLRNMSKQSQKLCNIWNLDQLVPKIQYGHKYKPEQYKRRILDRIRYIRQHESQSVIYDDLVQFQIVTTYRKIVEVGICLNLIQQRVKNNFYRSLNALQFDLDHMVKNSIAFNGEDNYVTDIGIHIRKQILKTFNLADQQLNKFNVPEEIKHHKKQIQKRNIKKKDSEQFVQIQYEPSIKIHEIRSLRNTRTRNVEQVQKKPHNNRNIRKIQEQSDFNGLQSQFQNQEKQQIVGQGFQKQEFANNKRQRRPQRISRDRHAPCLQKVQTTLRTRKYDKIDEDYYKEEQVYKNIKNHRNRSIHLDNSYGSSERNPATGGHATRRSGRLHN